MTSTSKVTRQPACASCVRALEEPLRQLSDNAGLEGSLSVGKVLELPQGIGLNVDTGEYVGSDRRRDHRPGHGDPLGACQRRIDCQEHHHHRSTCRRDARRGGGGMGGGPMMSPNMGGMGGMGGMM